MFGKGKRPLFFRDICDAGFAELHRNGEIVCVG